MGATSDGEIGSPAGITLTKTQHTQVLPKGTELGAAPFCHMLEAQPQRSPTAGTLGRLSGLG